jgi:anti-sigma factor RsiW
MDCAEVHPLLLDRRRGRLAPGVAAAVDAHLAECAACRHEDEADRALSAALEALPPRRAPRDLQRTLQARWGRPSRVPMRAIPWLAFAAGVLLAVAATSTWRAGGSEEILAAEAVNDHLRVLYSQRPLEVESADMHRAKPWFEGRLDFAPTTAFAGDDDFPLQGASVGYFIFIDRKAATFVFKRRLHVITLFVFEAKGLSWPAHPSQPVGVVRASLESQRGFHALLWQRGDLGYALVSDLNEGELVTLGAKIAGP